MSELYESMELWLTAERQQMAQPDALTAFLSDKAAMLDAAKFAPGDPRNTGATKSRTHIDQCGALITILESYDLNTLDTCKKLGELAAKSLKVASGYSMRAGYFHPNQPAGLYRDRMVNLVDADARRVPVLGIELASLEVPTVATDLSAAKRLLDEGRDVARHADQKLHDLLFSERTLDPEFSGNVEANQLAETITFAPKRLFVALSIAALQLQGDGPDGLGALILEPKSDAQANLYLRIDDLHPSATDEVISVTSTNTIARG